MDREPEVWRPVPVPWLDHYEVSTWGRVRNTSTDKMLKPWPGYGSNGKFYYKVNLYSRGQRKSYFIHRLVVMAFFEINHLDLDKSNNYWRNLEVTDRKGNDAHWRGSKAG